MFLSQVVGDGEAWLTELGWVHSWCKTQLVLINFILLRNRTSLALHSLRASVWKWGTSYTYFNNFHFICNFKPFVSKLHYTLHISCLDDSLIVTRG